MDSVPHRRKIIIDPVTRVEGHGKVTIRLDEKGQVEQARFHVVEFRGFEKFIQGRPFREVPVVIQRLCGICPVSHHLCAAKAMDKVIGVDRVPVRADKMRRLMHHGQILQSNALHFFHLASPDLLFGFDSPAAQRNIVGLAQRYPELAKRAILIRSFGQEVIAATGGRKIHTNSAIPGGFNQQLDASRRDELRQKVDQILGWTQEALELCQTIAREDWKRHSEFGSFPSSYMSLVGTDGAMDLYDGWLRAIDREGKIIFDGVKPEQYCDVLVEEVRSWSYMKFPHIRSLGKEEGWYRVGPLAQINCCSHIATPLAEQERQRFLKAGWGYPVHATLAYHWARIICMIHALEVIHTFLNDADLLQGELVAKGIRRKEGIAWIEAPRGTLFHHYTVGEDDLVKSANLIVSTTSNNEALNRSVTKVAEDYLSGQEITEGLLNHVEVAIRAYDPCLSCATHAIGKMPLVAILEGPDGQELTRRYRV
ncbi:Ni/Fe hydrogenase subunit alpha [Telmatocola sphagniphila]|uniref:Ni/Fe hydrogenase subunit alpha n=1 Tax=Telmatocola sphagniphila TaxID=1123043 RepID=A0A8E6BAE8_9BACT|nr:Ni/Fe hydrogenase subunit alpha [Telmatocola sphagniphila]QVL33513.1 Ni/Fe hydrogenase subunit alpha [Telmatocola sphagniphila]